MKTAVFGRDSGAEPGSPCGAPPSLTFTPPATLAPPLHHNRGNRSATGSVAGATGGQRNSGSGTSRRTSRMHNVSALGYVEFCKLPIVGRNASTDRPEILERSYDVTAAPEGLDGVDVVAESPISPSHSQSTHFGRENTFANDDRMTSATAMSSSAAATPEAQLVCRYDARSQSAALHFNRSFVAASPRSRSSPQVAGLNRDVRNGQLICRSSGSLQPAIEMMPSISSSSSQRPIFVHRSASLSEHGTERCARLQSKDIAHEDWRKKFSRELFIFVEASRIPSDGSIARGTTEFGYATPPLWIPSA
ncbi:unnamed protein product [Caenorhabditis auriculariae]|uniref:Uncharacterized protein n=1 Tax=Caenorhabditis auriculariae TaxID=2777116 RepID=A0A8S1GXQ3_9PELO|nr:unnamed protein product [Caenorhabditis auriculariae]